MDDLAVRVSALLRILLPFLFFMASVYLALHIVVARLTRSGRRSPVLWFFSVITGPLTRPVRAVLPPGTPESRVLALSLGMYVGLWLVTRLLLASLLPAGA